jgi:glycosyltransferase involved in cell wall biosynthesis
MRVLVVDSIFHMGGAERVTYDLITRLGSAEYEVIFCTFYEPGPMGEVFVQAGYRLYHHLMRNKYDPRVLLQLRRIVATHRIDLIYLVTQPVTLFWGVVFAKLFGLPIVALVSSTVVLQDALKLRLYPWLMPLVNRVVAVSHVQKDRLVQETGVRPDLVSVIHNGVDVRRFDAGRDRMAARRQAGLSPDSRVVGLIGRLVGLKAVDVLLGAAKLITERRTGVEFAIVGTGPELEALRALAQSLGVEKDVRFTGFIKDPATIIGCFDIGVLCSRTEALPIAVLEYMAGGIPCVVTDVGGMKELVTDGENGFVIQPDDPVALAAKIMELLDDPDLARRMGRKGRERVAHGFTMEAMVRNTTDLFREITSS